MMSRFLCCFIIIFVFTVTLSKAQMFSPSAAFLIAYPYWNGYGSYAYPYNPSHAASVSGGIAANLLCADCGRGRNWY